MTDQAQMMREALSHQDELVVYAYGMLRDWATAEDAVQDALIIVWERWDSFHGDSPVRAWILGIVRNRCRELLRQRSKLRPCDDQALIERIDQALTLEPAAETGGERLRELAAALQRCLAKLGTQPRKLMERYYTGTGSREAIAAEFGMSMTSLYKSAQRLRETLRDCVARQRHPGDQP